MMVEIKKSKLVQVGYLIMILSISTNIILQKIGIVGAILDHY